MNLYETLDDIVTKAFMPVRAVDDFILRQYTKAVTAYERKGKSRYPVALVLIPCSMVETFFGYVGLYNSTLPSKNMYDLIHNHYSIATFTVFWCLDSNRTVMEYNLYLYFRTFTPFRDPIEKKIWSSLLKKPSPYIRFPLFAAAVGYASKGVVDIYHAYNGEASLSDAGGAFQLAFGLFSLSSSMYIKDADKDILKKDPLWKEMYHGIKDALSSTPPPVSVPVR